MMDGHRSLFLLEAQLQKKTRSLSPLFCEGLHYASHHDQARPLSCRIM
jgi:hypothetical protein